MRKRELFKEVLKSLSRGRLHRLINFLLLTGFLYITFLVGRELFSYYLTQKEKVKFSVSSPRLSFKLKDGEIDFKFKALKLQLPGFKLYGEEGEVEFLPFKSLREAKLVFKKVKVDELSINLSKRGREKRKKINFIPLKVDYLNLGRVSVKYGNSYYLIREVEKKGSKAFFGGLVGKVEGKKVEVYPFEVVLCKDGFKVPLIHLVYGNYSLRGSLEGKERGKFLLRSFFSIFCSSCGFYYSGNIKLYGKEIEGEGRGKYRKYPIELSFKGRGSWESEKVDLKRVKVLFGKARLEGLGSIGLREVSVKGKFSSESISVKGVKLIKANGSFSVYGPLKSPEVVVKGSLYKVASELLVLKGGTFKIRVDKERRLYLRYRCGSSAELFFKYFNGNYSGEIKFRGFSYRNFTASGKKWFPKFSVNGILEFRGKGKRVFYRGRILPSELSVFGYEGTVKGEVLGNQEEFSLSLTSQSSKGYVFVKGKGSVVKRSLDLNYRFKGLELSSISFLKKLGLKGKVSGEGILRGKLKSLYSEAGFESEGLSLKGVNLGSVKGKIVYKGDKLSILATSSEGITLQNFLLSFKEKKVNLKVLFKEAQVGELLKIPREFKVNVPLSLRGVSSGSFKLELPLKNAKELSFYLKIDEYAGSVNYGKLLNLEGVKGKGELLYSQRKLEGKFKVHFQGGKLKKLKLAQGEGEVLLKGRELEVNFEKANLAGSLKGIEGRGNLVVNLDSKELKGSVKLRGSVQRDFVSLGGVVFLGFDGSFGELTVKVSGKLNLTSKYLKEGEEVKVKGEILEPENVGNVAVLGKSFNLRLLFLEDQERLVGKVRNLGLKFEKGEGEIRLAFVNVDVVNLSGSVIVPTFTVKPYGFYKLYSPTGIYINMKNGKVKISNFSLAYIDGWIDFNEVQIKPVSGKFKGSVGIKGLVYLKGLQEVIPYSKGNVALEGDFKEDKGKVEVNARIQGENISFKSPYILEKVEVNSLEALIRKSSLTELSVEATAGNGNFVAKGNSKEVKMALSQIQVGQIGLWKGLISGSLNYSQMGLSGNLAVSKAKVNINKNSSEGKGKEIKIPLKVGVKVFFEEPLKLSSELFWIEILPKLNLTTVNGKLTISGSFYITRGEIDYMGKKFKVIYGSGTIEDLSRKKGRISLVASTYISGYYVYMKVEGKLSSPTIYLTSDPPLTREEIMNLIMTGATPEQVEESSELFPAVQIAYYAVSTVFKPIEEKFQKSLGLERFSLEPYITKYGETVAKLTLAKELSKRIRIVGYGTTGQNPEYGGSIDFFFSNKRKYYLELRYNSYYGIETGIGLDVRIK